MTRDERIKKLDLIWRNRPWNWTSALRYELKRLLNKNWSSSNPEIRIKRLEKIRDETPECWTRRHYEELWRLKGEI